MASEREDAYGRQVAVAVDQHSHSDFGLFGKLHGGHAVEDQLVVGERGPIARIGEPELRLADEGRGAGEGHGHHSHPYVNNHAAAGPAHQTPRTPGPHRQEKLPNSTSHSKASQANSQGGGPAPAS